MFNRVFEKITQLLLLWVVLAVIAGSLFPKPFILCKSYTELLFAVTMFGIGMLLSLEDFSPIFHKPHLVLLGTLTQFAIMPASGFVVAKALNLPRELAIGVILTGAVPGAMASNVLSYLAGADVAYSIALTSTSTFLSPLLTPFFTHLFAHTLIKVDFLSMFFGIIKMVILPLILGFVIKLVFKDRLQNIIKVFPAISTIFIAFICGLVVALNNEYLAKINMLIFVAILLHNLIGLSLGYAAGKLYGFSQKRCRTLSLEVGMQNAGLGAVLALKHFTPQSAIPNAFFAILCIITASILARIWSTKKETL